jgi:RimJ/RimL family protein N-acetyltransferase
VTDAVPANHVAQDPQRREVRITTPRLLLRDIVAADTEALLALWNEPASHANILRGQRDPARNARRLASYARYNDWAAWQDREVHALAVCLRDEATVVGSCHTSYFDRRTVILGWHYGGAHAGRGYATEAARALLQFAFAELGMHRAVADCFEGNHAVVAVLHKLGMTRERGRLRDWWRGLRHGELRPAARFAIHRDASDSLPAAGAPP